MHFLETMNIRENAQDDIDNIHIIIPNIQKKARRKGAVCIKYIKQKSLHE
jgi:hypothetical protein